MSRSDDLVVMVRELRDEVRRMKLERASSAIGIAPGLVMINPMRTLPAGGWLWADGVAISRTTYAPMFEAIVPLLGAVTIDISTDVFTLTAHGLIIGDAVYFTTTGALPTGLSANTLYYVRTVPSSSTFTVSATRTSTAVGSQLLMSGSQSGVHSIRACPHGLGNGSSTFNKPDYRGVTLVGADAVPGGSDRGLLDLLNTLAIQVGAQTVTLTGAESGLPQHQHANVLSVGQHKHDQWGSEQYIAAGGGSDIMGMTFAGVTGTPRVANQDTGWEYSDVALTNVNAGPSNASSAHQNMQPSALTYFIVKT